MWGREEEAMQLEKSRGTLEVPKYTNVLYVEPAIVYSVETDDIIFFENLPTIEKKNIKSIEREKAGIEDREFIRLKSKGATEDKVSHGNLKKNTDILVRPFVYQNPLNPGEKIVHPFLMQVCTFEKLKNQLSHLPESGNEIKLLHVGYIYKDDLIKSCSTSEKFIPNTTPLFEENFSKNSGGIEFIPATVDIKQSWMGNCFFLAAINSILNNPHLGPDFIRSMMKQQKDGTVIVKLFHPETFEPIYVRVEDSEHYKEEELAHKHTARWIHILEKAYAGLNMKNKSEKNENQALVTDAYEVAPGSFLSSFGGGGKSDFALKILTGQPAQEIIIRKNQTVYPFSTTLNATFLKKMKDIFSDIVWYNPDPALNAILDNLKNNPHQYEDAFQILKNVVKEKKFSWLDNQITDTDFYQNFKRLAENSGMNPDEVLEDWGIYFFIVTFNLSEISKKLDDITHSHAKLASGEYIPSTKQELTDVIDALEKLSLPPPKEFLDLCKRLVDVQSKLTLQVPYHDPKAEIEEPLVDKDETMTGYLLNGELFSGEYTPYQLELFYDLRRRWLNDEVLTASTPPEKFSEKNVLGLRAGHAYSIMALEEGVFEGKKLLYVRLRNPWAVVGREYQYNQESKTAEITENKKLGEFRIEISEFCKYYDSYTFGRILPAMPHLNVEQVEEQKEEIVMAPNLAIDPTIPVAPPVPTNKKEASKKRDKEFKIFDKAKLIDDLINSDVEKVKDFLNTQSLGILFDIRKAVLNRQLHLFRELRTKTTPGEIKTVLTNVDTLQHSLINKLDSFIDQKIIEALKQDLKIRKDFKAGEEKGTKKKLNDADKATYDVISFLNAGLVNDDIQAQSDLRFAFSKINQKYVDSLKENIISVDLKSSFHALKKKEEQQNFVVNLSLLKNNLQPVIQKQSLNDIYKLALYLESDIKETQNKLKSTSNKKVKKILKGMIKKESKQLKIIKHEFKNKFKSSDRNLFDSIKRNAKAYVEHNSKKSIFKFFRNGFRSLFKSETPDAYIKEYKNHKKYLKLKKELCEVELILANNECRRKLNVTENSIVIDSITKNSANDYVTCYRTQNGQKCFLTLTKQQVLELTDQQNKFIESTLEKIKKSGNPPKQYALDYVLSRQDKLMELFGNDINIRVIDKFNLSIILDPANPKLHCFRLSDPQGRNIFKPISTTELKAYAIAGYTNAKRMEAAAHEPPPPSLKS